MTNKIWLPLYSDNGRGKFVGERSGLNQWNAEGRIRDSNEVYIPVPAWIHTSFKGFFPARNVPFSLKLSNGDLISAKICQQGNKALMSNPNRLLGRWLLRQKLKLEPDKVIDYEMLVTAGTDSVVVRKVTDNYFEIDICSLGSYELFKDMFKP